MKERTTWPAATERGAKLLSLVCGLARIICSVAVIATRSYLLVVAAFLFLAPAWFIPELMAWRRSRAAVEAARRAPALPKPRLRAIAPADVHVPAIGQVRHGSIDERLQPEIERDSPSRTIH